MLEIFINFSPDLIMVDVQSKIYFIPFCPTRVFFSCCFPVFLFYFFMSDWLVRWPNWHDHQLLLGFLVID
jgi:hypothetical protein